MRLSVFGLGNFGSQVAVELGAAGHDVLAVDRREDRVQAIRDSVNRAVVADCTDRQTLDKLGVAQANTAVVSLGTDLAPSILLTLYLKELGVGRVMVKAVHDDHAAVLTKIGADEVIFPEREMAKRLAHSLASPNIVEYVPLAPGWAIAEMETPANMVGRSLLELDLRRKWELNVLALKRDSQVVAVTDPTLKLGQGDMMVLMGKDEDIDRFRTKAK